MKTIYYTLAITGKEIQVILKDRFWLVILFLLPMLIGGFLGAINLATNPPVGEEGKKKGILLQVGLVNLDTGDFGTEVTKAIQEIDQFEVQAYSAVDQAQDRVAQGEVTAAIIIPANFSQKIDAYSPTEIEVIVDPAEPEGASIVTGIINQVVGEVTIWGEVQHGVRSIFEESGLLAQANPQEQRAIEAQNLGVIMTRINETRRNPAILVVSEDLQGAKIAGRHRAIHCLYVCQSDCDVHILHRGDVQHITAGGAGSRHDPAAAFGAGAARDDHCRQDAGLHAAGLLAGGGAVRVANLLLRAPLGRSPLALVVMTLVVTFTAAAMGMMVAALAKSASQASSIGLILAFVLAALGGAMPAASKEPIGRAGGFLGSIAKLTPHNYAVEVTTG